MKKIVELSKKYNTDKKMNDGTKSRNGLMGHDYAQQYDDMLKDINVKSMLEIGVSFGGSIKMWDEYFDNKCVIYGVDIEETRFKKEDLITDNVRILIGDQSSESFLEKSFSEKFFDFIVDDGSHRISHQQISFKKLFNNLKSGGLYVIEDLHTSRIPSFFDSNPETTTLEMLQHLKEKKQYFSNYIDKNEYNDIMLDVDSVEIFENKIAGTEKIYIIAFIKKR